MAGQDSRVGDRQTASMRIKLKYPDVDTFIQKYAVNISRGGIFIATKNPKAVGTFVKFEFLLSDAGSSSIIRGEGQVQWTKEFDPQHPGKPHGMGVKFTRLDAESQTVIDRALKWRAEHGTNPGAPVPVPTSSAHTISAQSRESSRAEPLPAPLPVDETRPEPIAPPVVAPAMPAEMLPPAEPPMLTMPAGRETRPIAIDDDDVTMGRPPDVHTRPIPLRDLPARARPGDDIDALVAEWGVSEEKLQRILNGRGRRRAGLEATAELERLLLKPPKLPTPTKAEALAQLGALLSRGKGKNGASSH